MKRMLSFEEFKTETTLEPDGFRIGENLQKMLDEKHIKKFEVVNLASGEVGLILEDTLNKSPMGPTIDTKNWCVYQMFEQPNVISCSQFDVFKQSFNKLIEKGFYLVRLDDYAALKLGFLCFSKSGVTWFQISVCTFRQGSSCSWQGERKEIIEIKEAEEILAM